MIKCRFRLEHLLGYYVQIIHYAAGQRGSYGQRVRSRSQDNRRARNISPKEIVGIIRGRRIFLFDARHIPSHGNILSVNLDRIPVKHVSGLSGTDAEIELIITRLRITTILWNREVHLECVACIIDTHSLPLAGVGESGRNGDAIAPGIRYHTGSVDETRFRFKYLLGDYIQAVHQSPALERGHAYGMAASRKRQSWTDHCPPVNGGVVRVYGNACRLGDERHRLPVDHNGISVGKIVLIGTAVSATNPLAENEISGLRSREGFLDQIPDIGQRQRLAAAGTGSAPDHNRTRPGFHHFSRVIESRLRFK